MPDPFDSNASEDQPISLDKLSESFARLFVQPLEAPALDEVIAPDAARALDDDIAAAVHGIESEPGPLWDDLQDLSPKNLLEAMLFVGSADNAPLTAEQAAAVMRGVQAEEIAALVTELNQQYQEDDCPYWIVSQQSGYRLLLKEEYSDLRDRFLGRQRQARLSQAAIDVLAIVAYNEPLSGDEVSRLRGAASGPVLSQLVRRQLLQIHRPAHEPRRPLYCTTGRFLELFGLENLSDLPRSQDIQSQ